MADVNITYGVVKRLEDQATDTYQRSFNQDEAGMPTVAAASRAYASGILEALRELGLIERG